MAAGSRDQLRDVVDRLQREAGDLRRSRKRLAEAADADRRVIERALHDGVQQHLVALAVELRRLDGLLDGDPSAVRALVDELAAIVREAIDVATELARRIYPPLLEAQGLAIALRSAAEHAGVTLLVDVPRGAGYPPEVVAAIYWVCVEALSSAPPGSEASVRVADADHELAFEIAVAGHDERSMQRLRDRVETLDGRVSIDRDAGGSRIHAWLPLSG